MNRIERAEWRLAKNCGEYRKKVKHPRDTLHGDAFLIDDGQGKPSVFKYNGRLYSYLYNLQGDVEGLVDTSGNVVVEYKYDAWGKLQGTTGSLASTIGQFNPLRYIAKEQE